MRILYSASLACVLALVSFTVSYAACREGALGTHRTITLDPSKHQRIVGFERRLGLQDKEVVLTFDDGPRAGTTQRILDALKHECVKATFFAVGKMARAYPKLTKRIIAQGHTLAHHTQTHERLPRYSTAKAGKIIQRGMRSVEKAAYGSYDGKPRVPFFRFPYLARTKSLDRMVARKGLIAFDANIDSLDWKKVSPNRVHNRTMRVLRREGKGIILLHDIQNRTAKMLPKLLRTLKSEGYKIVHIVPPRGIPEGPQSDEPTVVASANSPERQEILPMKAPSKKVQAAEPKSQIYETSSPIDVFTKQQSRTLIQQALADMAPVDDLGPTIPSIPPKLLPPKAPKAKRNRTKDLTQVAFDSRRTNTMERSPVKNFNGWKLRPSQWIIR